MWGFRGGFPRQRSKGRLAFFFKEGEGISILGKGKELLAHTIHTVSALLSSGEMNVRQRRRMAAPKETQDPPKN